MNSVNVNISYLKLANEVETNRRYINELLQKFQNLTYSISAISENITVGETSFPAIVFNNQLAFSTEDGSEYLKQGDVWTRVSSESNTLARIAALECNAGNQYTNYTTQAQNADSTGKVASFTAPSAVSQRGIETFSDPAIIQSLPSTE